MNYFDSVAAVASLASRMGAARRLFYSLKNHSETAGYSKTEARKGHKIVIFVALLFQDKIHKRLFISQKVDACRKRSCLITIIISNF